MFSVLHKVKKNLFKKGLKPQFVLLCSILDSSIVSIMLIKFVITFFLVLYNFLVVICQYSLTTISNMNYVNTLIQRKGILAVLD